MLSISELAKLREEPLRAFTEGIVQSAKVLPLAEYAAKRKEKTNEPANDKPTVSKEQPIPKEAKVMDMVAKRNKKNKVQGRKCVNPKCDFMANSLEDWDIGVGTDTGFYVCPNCETIQDGHILSSRPGCVMPDDKGIAFYIPNDLIDELREYWEEGVAEGSIEEKDKESRPSLHYLLVNAAIEEFDEYFKGNLKFLGVEDE